MLYVYHGTDVSKSAGKANALARSLLEKKSDASFVKIGADDWSPDVLTEHACGQGLFSGKYIILLDRVSENPLAKDALVDSADILAGSANIFIVVESKLNVAQKKAFEKYASKLVVTELSVVQKKVGADFNIFALADAVSARERSKSWAIFRQAIDNGHEMESIIGTLFWQVKSMKQASGADGAAKSGLNPFVFSKAQRGAKNYSAQELAKLTASLIDIYHDGHRGLVDMELATEHLLLQL